MQIKIEKMKSLKRKPRKAKRDDWKRDRNMARKAKAYDTGEDVCLTRQMFVYIGTCTRAAGHARPQDRQGCQARRGLHSC